MIQPCFSPGRVTGLCGAVSIGAEAWGAGSWEPGWGYLACWGLLEGLQSWSWDSDGGKPL